MWIASSSSAFGTNVPVHSKDRSEPERAHEPFVAPPGKHRERDVGAGERVHGLVDRPVAAEDDDEVDAVVDGLGRELARVTLLFGFRNLERESADSAFSHRERWFGNGPATG